MIGSEYTPAQTRGQERWRVVDGGNRFTVDHCSSSAFIALDQYGRVRLTYGLEKAGTSLWLVVTLADRLARFSPVKRHGTGRSEARRLLCQRFADALNAELGA